MVDMKKEQEREEFHRAIWAIAGRGGWLGLQKLCPRHDVLSLHI